MQNTQQILAYWRSAQQVQTLVELAVNKYKQAWQTISSEECRLAKISAPEIVSSLLQHGTDLIVAPIYAERAGELFVPYVLQVELNSEGQFKCSAVNNMPLFLRANLEPAKPQPICLGAAEDFDNYFVLKPAPWIDKPGSLTWSMVLEYATEMLQTLTESRLKPELQSQGFVIAESALVLPLASVHVPNAMDMKLISSRSKLQLVSAERNSNVKQFLSGVVIDAWIEAAVKQAPAPKIAYCTSNEDFRYSTIFAATSETADVAEPGSADNIQQIHKGLSQLFNSYIRGKQVERNWLEICNNLLDKYNNGNGLDSRISQLQALLKDAQVRFRHMQVLESIWLRQLELLPTWTRYFDVFPLLQKRRLHRLYQFFKQNFPSEKTEGFSQAQFVELMNENLRRARNSERFIADALHQSTSDARQQQLIAEKLIQWGQSQTADIQTPEAAVDFLHNTLRPQLINSALKYWHAYFNLQPDAWQELQEAPTVIEKTIFERAQYISPMCAAEILARSQTAIIAGSYQSICVPRFPVQIDYELTRHYGLSKCDADFEDLQFDGVAASVGNLWNLAAQGKETDRDFEAMPNENLKFDIIHVDGESEDYLGSRVNRAEVAAILDWLTSNPKLAEKAAIYTCFGGQVVLLEQALEKAGILQVPVYILQQPIITCKQISIFSPVYAASDPGPYSFDRGSEILENLYNNTEQTMLIIGNKHIFKPSMHSASGNLAKLLPQYNIESQEVECV